MSFNTIPNGGLGGFIPAEQRKPVQPIVGDDRLAREIEALRKLIVPVRGGAR